MNAREFYFFVFFIGNSDSYTFLSESDSPSENDKGKYSDSFMHDTTEWQERKVVVSFYAVFSCMYFRISSKNVDFHSFSIWALMNSSVSSRMASHLSIVG